MGALANTIRLGSPYLCADDASRLQGAVHGLKKGLRSSTPLS